MRTLERWNPFPELEQFENQLSNFWGDNGSSGSGWSPAVDLLESADEYLVKADLPEVRKQDLELVVENGALTISGERKAEREDKKWRTLSSERTHGRFSRTIALPGDVDPDRIHAQFKNGVLSVILPRDEKTKPKYIEISD